MGTARTTARKLLAEARAVPSSVLREDRDRRLLAFLHSPEWLALTQAPPHPVGRAFRRVGERVAREAGLASADEPLPEGFDIDAAVERLARTDPEYPAAATEFAREVEGELTRRGFRYHAARLLSLCGLDPDGRPLRAAAEREAAERGAEEQGPPPRLEYGLKELPRPAAPATAIPPGPPPRPACEPGRPVCGLRQPAPQRPAQPPPDGYEWEWVEEGDADELETSEEEGGPAGTGTAARPAPRGS